MYSSATADKSDVLKFLRGSRFIVLEILVIIYASGSATFGISVEIYLLLPYTLANCILVARNCGGSDVLKRGIIWLIKVFTLFLAVELCYCNFRRQKKYKKYFIMATRAMLKQALFFSMTMLYLSSLGLRTLYRTINKSLPYHCTYDISHCGIVDLFEPLFSYDVDDCLDDLTDYVIGREEIRVLRNFMLFNGISYAVFSKNFLDIGLRAEHKWLRFLLVALLITLSTSVVVANVDPLVFINKCQLAYDVIECIIFIIMLCLLAFNLYQIRKQESTALTQTDTQRMQKKLPTMERAPRVLPQY